MAGSRQLVKSKFQSLKLKSKNMFMFYCFLIAVVKIILVSKNEMVVMPYDAEAYVSRAMSDLWHIGLMHPGYPIWLRFTHELGLPQRISIELLYLASCFFLAVLIRRYINNTAAILLFFVLVFAPFTFFLFDQALSDGFYLCLTLFAVTFSFKLLCNQKLSNRNIVFNASGLGLTLGLMLMTRAEDQLIIFWICALTATYVLFRKQPNDRVLSIKFWHKPFYLFFCTAFCSFIVLNIISTVFYVNDGISARSLTLLPQHYKLLENLAIIDTGIPQQQYIPISKASRILAYEVSPSLKSLRDHVENKDDNILHAESKQAGLPDGEIGAGWIWWVFIGAVNATMPNPNPIKIENKFKEINQELEAAFSDKRLLKRFIVNPLIGGDVLQLLSNLPSAIFTVSDKLFSSFPYVSDRNNNVEIFNKTCNRRSALIGRSDRVVIQGWAFPDSSDNKILYVSPKTINGDFGKAYFFKRTDVSDSYEKKNGWRPEVYGYRAEINSSSIDNISLIYFLSDGTSVESNHFAEGIVSVVESNVNDNKVFQGIDIADLVTTNVRSGSRHHIQQKIVEYADSKASRYLVGSVMVTFLAFVFIKVKKKQYTNFGDIFAFQFFLLLIFSARILFYSLIDAASWHVNIRYLASAQALFFAFISISLVFIVAVTRSRIALKIGTALDD